MKEKSEFYTLKGYQIKNNHFVTESMEDYLEMMYRSYVEKKRIRVCELAESLNVKPSSVSKMVQKLTENNLVSSYKYGDVYLTEDGIKQGEYLLWRHNVLVSFFSFLNQKEYRLEQVEMIEHFIDPLTVEHMEKWIDETHKNQ